MSLASFHQTLSRLHCAWRAYHRHCPVAGGTKNRFLGISKVDYESSHNRQRAEPVRANWYGRPGRAGPVKWRHVSQTTPQRTTTGQRLIDPAHLTHPKSCVSSAHATQTAATADQTTGLFCRRRPGIKFKRRPQTCTQVYADAWKSAANERRVQGPRPPATTRHSLKIRLRDWWGNVTTRVCLWALSRITQKIVRGFSWNSGSR